MITIHKHTLDVGAPSTWVRQLPANAKLLHVASQDPVQHQLVHTWWELDPEAKKADRTFFVAGTGQPLPPKLHHVGSAISGPFVWHLYELVSQERLHSAQED